jgi:hypothetical protein
VTEDQAPRQNRDGHPCPPWCVTDHGKYSFHGGEQTTVEAPEYRTFHVRAVQHLVPGQPEIQVAADGIASVRLGDAADLAAIIEQLAAATPQQHRQLAAAIRQAAARITEAQR